MSAPEFDPETVPDEEMTPAEETETIDLAALMGEDLSAEDTPPIPEPAPAEAPPPPAPPKGPNKRTLRVVAIAVVAAVLIAAAGAFALPAILTALNPKAYVAACMAKTMADLGESEAGALAASIRGGRFSSEFSLHLGDQIPQELAGLAPDIGLSPADLPGTGFTFSAWSDVKNRQIAAEFGVDLGLYHAGSIRVFLDDSLLSFGSPELVDRDFYCVDTKTLGTDWNASPFFGQSGAVDPTLSFNIFEAMGQADDNTAAYQTYLDAITVEKTGSGITVTPETGGRSFSCTLYTMTIPADAARGFLGETVTATDIGSALADGLRSDMTIDFYISGGQVRLLDASLVLTGEDFPVDLSLSAAFLLEKSKSVYITVNAPAPDGGNSGAVAAFTRDGDNIAFSCDIKDYSGDTATLGMRGSLVADKAAKTVTAALDDITFTVDGETLSMTAGCSLSAFGPEEAFPFQPTGPIPLLSLDQGGLLNVLLQAMGGLQSIAQEMGTGQ